MDKIKWAVILFGFVFTVCTLLSVFSFLLVYSTAKQNEIINQNAEVFLQELTDKVDRIESSIMDSDNITADTTNEDVETDILYDYFSVREANGKIGIYTEEGYLIRTLQVDVQTLPEADRAALAEGIDLYSWRELIALIQDYEG